MGKKPTKKRWGSGSKLLSRVSIFSIKPYTCIGCLLSILGKMKENKLSVIQKRQYLSGASRIDKFEATSDRYHNEVWVADHLFLTNESETVASENTRGNVFRNMEQFNAIGPSIPINISGKKRQGGSWH